MPSRYRDAPHGERRHGDGRHSGRDDHERRSFGEEGRYSSDQARYYGADSRNYAPLHGPDHAAPERTPWRDGRGDEDHGYRSFDGDFHGGQEYGVPAGGSRRLPRPDAGAVQGDDLGYESRGRRRRSDFGDMPYGDQPLPHDRGARDFGPPADYAYHPGHQDLEPDYVAWRDEQMRNHDRDYAGWRAEQHRRYDEDYRSFRGERRERFGQTFAEWRAQRDAGQAPTPPAGDTPDDKV